MYLLVFQAFNLLVKQGLISKVMFTLTIDRGAGSNPNYPIHLLKKIFELWQVVY